ncbi:RNA polymerase sigma factor [Tengunoibacter tsumagoiensis]|uniref:RNA polymerase subunit sigma n=1 Tax=Tengunoibacter tsumagoiensis TaxID=2014871 RepID=A0A401ZUM6_9CHLR|nr:RNA polymerase sigma factor [Tengunoibacter tsumagoiensis]GCE10583.1 RNA polymerase subunit sigma [Tengunoibacter tsumagoiensis]
MKAQHSPILERAHLAHLYQQCAPKILEYIYRQVSSFADAEDILTDVFMASLESTLFASLTEPEQQAWLWRVARNKVIDTYRKSQRAPLSIFRENQEQFIDEIMPDPEQISIQQEEENMLAQLIKRLPPLQQRVLYLRFGENLRCAQIASQIGKRESSIRSLLSRALGLLRQHYHEQEKGGKQHETVR